MNIEIIINNAKSFSFKKRTTVFAILILVFVIGIIVWYIFFHKAVPVTNSGIVSVVNHEKLYSDDLIPYIKGAKEKIIEESILKSKKPDLSPYKVLTKALNDMISVIVQGQKAKDYNVSLSTVDIKNLETSNSDVTDIHIKKFHQDNALADKLKEKLVSQEKSDVSEKDIEAFYEQYKNKFVVWPKYNIQQILIPTIDGKGKRLSLEEKDSTKSEAQNIFTQIKSGASFDKMAKRYSSDDKTKDNGGYTGLVEANELNSQIADKLPNIRIGELKLEESPGGYIIYRLIEKTDQRLETLDEARNEIVYALSQSQGNANSYENIVNKWVAQSTIEKYYGVLGKIDITKLK